MTLDELPIIARVEIEERASRCEVLDEHFADNVGCTSGHGWHRQGRRSCSDHWDEFQSAPNSDPSGSDDRSCEFVHIRPY